MNFSSYWHSFHDRARRYGNQSETARKRAEALQAIALGIEICTLSAASGAMVGAKTCTPHGAAIGASVGLGIGIVGTVVVHKMYVGDQDNDGPFPSFAITLDPY